MIQFKSLRLNGFKSFVERTELEIGPGLNGIVGPNGCGKSNLVEALRWIMGESSAKKMRGGAMEDVIFNGTEKRARRNLAEVCLLLDNTTRTAAAAYNGSDELEIVRRIERDHGSSYKINGCNARARDVQMLFADTVTGANSPALVSQGRVTQMINAKPLDRRLILEESAGISGLFARRHEAELRLKAADTNLARLEDLLGGMEGRLNALKRQARQAASYRNLSAQIRQLEILLAYMEWKTLEERMKTLRGTFETAESLVAEHLATVTQLTATQTTQARDLPALREAEAKAAAALQAQKLALQRIEDETAHHEKTLADTQEQAAQTDTDHAHACTEIEDNTKALERIEAETQTIQTEQSDSETRLAEKRAIRDEMENKVLELEAGYNALMQNAAESKARKDALLKRIESAATRLETLQSRKAEAQSELDALPQTKPESGPDFGENTVATLEKQAQTLQQTIEATQNKLNALAPSIETARETLRKQETAYSEFSAEIKLLEGILKEENEDGFRPVLDTLTPESGFEKALSRALGDSLMASLDEKAASAWLTAKAPKTDLPALPADAAPLLPHVKAPAALQTALSQIGLAGSEEDGDRLWENLRPGQSLVSRDGTYWRWDGYRIRAEALDRRARHLEQKNKLAALNTEKPKAQARIKEAEKTLASKLNEEKILQTALHEKTAAKNDTDKALTQARAALAARREEQARLDSETRRLHDILDTAQTDIRDLETQLCEDRAQLQACETDAQDDKTQRLESLKDTLSETRRAYNEAVRAFDMIHQQQNTRQARLHAIADERISLQNRLIRARERLKDLEERKTALAEKLEELKHKPLDFADKKEALLDTISALEEKRTNAAEDLAETESAVNETTRALKEAESTLGEAREARAHAQATLSALQEQHNTLESAIVEKFEMPPHDLPRHAAIDMDKEWEDLESLRTKKEDLTRRRDAIGPVNLRAETEVTELESEVGGLLHEKQDLMQAVEELRGGIRKINTEARERLLAAFEHVNAHFGRLFVQLFGGGKAHLALIDSDDPLQSGLEIFAQPPGKALQSLSLLSGGEQTLASIALIFAMFLTNPSPICVLDEIDAPLDDANVDRVCDLLDEIAERGETRFLVITHHRLTMARMDRLYGVTMAEKGISQLVSVDLQQSFDFLEAA